MSTEPTGPSEPELEEREAFWRSPTRPESTGEGWQFVSLWLNVALELPEARFLLRVEEIRPPQMRATPAYRKRGAGTKRGVQRDPGSWGKM